MTTMTQLGTTNTVFYEEPGNLVDDGPDFEMFDVPRINEADKAFWIDKLLTEYADKQGRNALKTPDGKFCCLGVYCEAKNLPSAIRPGVYTFPETGEREKVEMTHYGLGDGAITGVIPSAYAIRWRDEQTDATCLSYGLGFTGDEDLFVAMRQDGKGPFKGGERWSLPRLNDSGDFTFAQIADIIRYFL